MKITMPANPLIPTKKQPTNQTSNRLTNYSNVRPNKSSSQLTNAMTNQTIRQLSHLLTNELHLCQASAIFCSSLIFLIFFPHKLGCFLPCNNHFAGGQQTILPTTSEETTTSSSSPNSSIVATTSTPGADMQPVAAHYQQVA